MRKPLKSLVLPNTKIAEILLTVGLLILSPTNAWSWGDYGHEVVGEIAQRLLAQDTKTLQAIQDIIGVEPLALAAVWPDHVRYDKRFDPFADYHFKDEPASPDEHKDFDAGVVLKKYPSLLASTVTSRETKMLALRYLIHVVADVHQPLHLGIHADFGGNACKMHWKVGIPSPPSCDGLSPQKLEAFGYPVKVAVRPAVPFSPPPTQFPTNLHEVWDEHMVDYLREWVRRDQFCLAEKKTPGVMKFPARQFTYSEFTQELVSRHASQLDLTTANLDIDSWMTDSTELRKSVGYPDTLPQEKRLYCVKKPAASDLPNLEAAFMESPLAGMTLNRRELVEKRLILAGVRLAALLQKTLQPLSGGSPGPSEAQVLKDALIKSGN